MPIYNPAITIVLEWSSAEIGVGAFIALSSHELKGNWADLVNNTSNEEIIRRK